MTETRVIADPVFQFKANFAPCTILQMLRYDLEALEIQLAEAIQRAPNFFLGSPLIIELEKIKSLGTISFSDIKKIITKQGLVPVGVRGGTDEQHTAAATAGLPMVSVGKSAAPEHKKEIVERHTTTKLITSPIRSGMQVYAKDGDLIVLSSVSHGAELLADGHIHVYGPLRGRALAGVKGNVNARIFCKQLEAELVSIAGYYLVKEDLQVFSDHEGVMQIYLDHDQVRVEAI